MNEKALEAAARSIAERQLPSQTYTPEAREMLIQQTLHSARRSAEAAIEAYLSALPDDGLLKTLDRLSRQEGDWPEVRPTWLGEVYDEIKRLRARCEELEKRLEQHEQQRQQVRPPDA